ncbi:MAG: hypothetical protein ABH800_01875 [Candidatus Nealsonbacteria bacterium]
MKNKILIILIVLVCLTASGVYIYKNPEKFYFSNLLTGEENKPLTNEKKTGEENIEETLKKTHLVKDEFEIILPAGWQEAVGFSETLLMAFDAEEELTDEKLIEIDFATYLSIKKDSLDKYGIDSVKEYSQSLKTPLAQSIEDLKFTEEREDIINEKEVFYMEIESQQEGIEYKTLLAFVEGNNNDIYVLSFNTSQNSWSSYKDKFYQMVESFNVRYNI